MGVKATKRFVLPGMTLAAIAVCVLVNLNGPLAGAQDDKRNLSSELRRMDSLDGRSLYRDYCASCHGEDAKGHGPAVYALKKQPPDLTRIGQRNGGRFPYQHVRNIISGEEAGIQAHGSREMPVWGPLFREVTGDWHLASMANNNLTKYLESIQGK